MDRILPGQGQPGLGRHWPAGIQCCLWDTPQRCWLGSGLRVTAPGGRVPHGELPDLHCSATFSKQTGFRSCCSRRISSGPRRSGSNPASRPSHVMVTSSHSWNAPLSLCPLLPLPSRAHRAPSPAPGGLPPHPTHTGPALLLLPHPHATHVTRAGPFCSLGFSLWPGILSILQMRL